MVQRHLLRWRQDLIDPYILAEKTFRGVFYQAPAEDIPTKAEKGTKGKRGKPRRSGKSFYHY